MPTLFEQIGGEGAVDAAVDLFYKKILADERISGFFAEVDIDAQIVKQKTFLTMAFGGPNSYTGKDLRQGHAHLVARGLDDEHFDAVIEHLESTLADLRVPSLLVSQVLNLAEETRNDVLCRKVA